MLWMITFDGGMVNLAHFSEIKIVEDGNVGSQRSKSVCATNTNNAHRVRLSQAGPSEQIAQKSLKLIYDYINSGGTGGILSLAPDYTPEKVAPKKTTKRVKKAARK